MPNRASISGALRLIAAKVPSMSREALAVDKYRSLKHMASKSSKIIAAALELEGVFSDTERLALASTDTELVGEKMDHLLRLWLSREQHETLTMEAEEQGTDLSKIIRMRAFGSDRGVEKK